jgi:hypothetical protein
VTNSLSKLGDEILTIRQVMPKLSSTLREELAEFKNILLSMNETKNATCQDAKPINEVKIATRRQRHEMTRKCWTVIPLVGTNIRSLLLTGLQKQSHAIACA